MSIFSQNGGDPGSDVHSMVRGGYFGFGAIGWNNTYYVGFECVFRIRHF